MTPTLIITHPMINQSETSPVILPLIQGCNRLASLLVPPLRNPNLRYLLAQTQLHQSLKQAQLSGGTTSSRISQQRIKA